MAEPNYFWCKKNCYISLFLTKVSTSAVLIPGNGGTSLCRTFKAEAPVEEAFDDCGNLAALNVCRYLIKLLVGAPTDLNFNL